MPTSYEDAVEQKQRETPEDEEYLKGFVNHAEELGLEFDGETLEEKFEKARDLLTEAPDFLRPTELDERTEINRPDGNINVPFGYQDIINQLNEGPSDIPALLQILARINALQLASLLDIANSVEPFSSITVSGENTIDDANNPQPVVPESDDELIPTRLLMIRSSVDNENEIFFGDDGVAPENGFSLSPGDNITLQTDLREEELYMACDEAGEQVELLGMF